MIPIGKWSKKGSGIWSGGLKYIIPKQGCKVELDEGKGVIWMINTKQDIRKDH